MALDMSFCSRKMALGAAFVVMFAASAPAHAVTYSFNRITDNGNGDIGSQLQMEVLDVGGTTVSFRFFHDGSTAANITEIYFDDGGFDGLYPVTDPVTTYQPGDDPVGNVLATPITVSTQGTVSFTPYSANPAELPGGNGINFVTSETTDGSTTPPTTQAFVADSAQSDGGVLSGQTPEEWVKLTFSYASGKVFSDVLAALTALDLRVGMHVRSIGTNGGSDGYVNNSFSDAVPEVPLPAALPLLLSAFGWLGFMGWRRRKHI